MTYRNELEQAHQRIEQLEEELQQERAKNEPIPTQVVRVDTAPEPRRAHDLPWFLWWPVPLTVVTAIACLFRIHDDVIPWLIRSACVASTLMSIESVLRFRNAGERTVIGRLLVVLACVVGAPAMLAAFFVGGPIVGVGFAIVAAVMGIVALVKWIVRGTSE
jgi:hypothetical protein